MTSASALPYTRTATAYVSFARAVVNAPRFAGGTVGDRVSTFEIDRTAELAGSAFAAVFKGEGATTGSSRRKTTATTTTIKTLMA